MAGHRADAILQADELDAATERSAQVTLADIATVVTGWSEDAEAAGLGDEETAKAMTREALEATGFIAYEPAQGRRHFGQIRESC